MKRTIEITTADGVDVAVGQCVGLWFALPRGGAFYQRGRVTSRASFVAQIRNAPRLSVADGYAHREMALAASRRRMRKAVQA
jgi:hypothetical protein